MNRFGKVPCIVDGDFRLAESVAIYRYLDRQYPVAPHWYAPDDTVRQARIDEYLAWQHLNIRADVTLYFFHVWLNPLYGKPVDAGKTERLRGRLEAALAFFERVLLADGRRPYLAGDTLSVADLSAACELEQAKVAGIDPCAGRPALAAWMASVREQTNPFYDEAHRLVYRLTPDTIPTPVLPDDG